MGRKRTVVEDGKKCCHKCGEIKHISNFGKNKNTYDGLQAYCKQCRKQHYKKNKDEILKIRKEYRNKPEIKKRMKKYLKKYVSENRESLQKVWKKYREENRESIKIVQTKYREDNREELRFKQKEIYKCYMENIYHRIRFVLIKRISRELKGKPKYTDQLLDLIGCTIHEFMNHIESQFKDGMSWNNFGEWEIDHIKPVSLFDLSKYDEQSKCFHYTNTQPLIAHENRVKRNKYEEILCP